MASLDNVPAPGGFRRTASVVALTCSLSLALGAGVVFLVVSRLQAARTAQPAAQRERALKLMAVSARPLVDWVAMFPEGDVWLWRDRPRGMSEAEQLELFRSLYGSHSVARGSWGLRYDLAWSKGEASGDGPRELKWARVQWWDLSMWDSGRVEVSGTLALRVERRQKSSGAKSWRLRRVSTSRSSEGEGEVTDLQQAGGSSASESAPDVLGDDSPEAPWREGDLPEWVRRLDSEVAWRLFDAELSADEFDRVLAKLVLQPPASPR